MNLNSFRGKEREIAKRIDDLVMGAPLGVQQVCEAYFTTRMERECGYDVVNETLSDILNYLQTIN
jgi:hypothetical protein